MRRPRRLRAPVTVPPRGRSKAGGARLKMSVFRRNFTNATYCTRRHRTVAAFGAQEEIGARPVDSTAVQAQKVQGSLPRLSQDLLNRALDAHERFTRREPGARRAVIPFMQAPGLDFSRRLLCDVEFRGANLQRARLTSANLQRASLYCADLRGADLREANLTRADIRGASLRQANLSGATLNDADLREGRLVLLDVPEGFRSVGKSGLGSKTEEISFSVDFTNCSMKGVKLANSKLKGANFSGALLHNADFAGANLTGCNFDGAVLIGVDLKQARFDPGALAKSIVDPGPAAVGRAAELLSRISSAARWVETDGEQDRAANLDGEDLRPLANAFVGRQLTALSARRVCAIGVNFAGAKLQGANFEGADLREADFTGADLRGASFRGAKLWFAKFSKADVRPLSLDNGSSRAIDLTEALFSRDCFAASVQA